MHIVITPDQQRLAARARDLARTEIKARAAEVLRNVVAGSILNKKLPQTRDGYLRDATE